MDGAGDSVRWLKIDDVELVALVDSFVDCIDSASRENLLLSDVVTGAVNRILE